MPSLQLQSLPGLRTATCVPCCNAVTAAWSCEVAATCTCERLCAMSLDGLG